MTLERYRDAKRHIRYRLDGKLITAKQANEERANNPSLEFIDKVEPTVKKVVACSDQYTAIRQIVRHSEMYFINVNFSVR